MKAEANSAVECAAEKICKAAATTTTASQGAENTSFIDIGYRAPIAVRHTSATPAPTAAATSTPETKMHSLRRGLQPCRHRSPTEVTSAASTSFQVSMLAAAVGAGVADVVADGNGVAVTDVDKAGVSAP